MARKILLADDSVTAQNMGRKILSDAGYDVITVNNGSAALKRVAEQKPDLIVLDVYMPGYSGLEVCQRLKDSEETEGIPVLLTVGKLEPFKPEEARRVRADAYIVKPFEASELLTALTRMEDRMVPGQNAASRSNSGDPDTGWKNRLRFPSKKKKEEIEPEPEMDFATGQSFRNFRRGKGKAQSSTADTGKTVPAAAPTFVPDIPRDITPEELDALSALAAKLDGEGAPAEESAPVVEKTPVEAKADLEVATSGEEKNAGEVAVVPVAQPGGQESPVAEAVQGAAAEASGADPVAAEAKPTKTVHVETLAVSEPAPVDRDDEPVFATAAAPIETFPVSQEEKIVGPEVPVAVSEVPAGANRPETIEIQAKSEEQKPPEQTAEKGEEVAPVVEAAKSEEPPAVEVTPTIEETAKAEEIAETIPVVKTVEEAEVGPGPTAEELAEALRLLTPALGHPDPSLVPSRETLVAAGAMLAEEAARNAAAAKWMAAAVAVSSQEAALSLEAEMFQTLAGSQAPGTDAGVNVATAALSPAAAELKVEIAAEAGEPIPAPASEPTGANIEASEPKVTEETSEEPEPATFADAVQRNEIEVVATTSGSEPVIAEEPAHPVVETTGTSASEAAGGEDEMSKERGKNGKSNWHQIRTGTAGAGTNDPVEAAKHAEAAEESPKAMAAAAAEGTRSAPASESAAIASIVDSVLADLRPKIVEEIAKKLAKKD